MSVPEFASAMPEAGGLPHPVLSRTPQMWYHTRMSDPNRKITEDRAAEVPVRLNKYMSDAGVCSRREADRLIEAGKVTIDGKTAVPGQKVAPGQRVLFEKKEVKPAGRLILIAFNKPAGIECTSSGRVQNNIIKYINYPERIYPIGRLDKDSTGLILLTNAGGLVNKMLKAGGGHEKEYLVTVNKPLTKDFLAQMRSGVGLKYDEVYSERIKHGRAPRPGETVKTLPCRVEAAGKAEFRITLTQGLNRQIRRMCTALGYRVLSLKRIRIMNIQLGNLPEGHWRNISEAEINRLMKELDCR